ncbi:natural cytotoxicity triggering receptor 1-like [Rhynchocyon petersi]
MPSTLTVLLYLGLCLSQMVSSQQNTLLKPIIWAKPNFMIPKGKPVTIWCQGSLEAVEYQLFFKEQFFTSKKQESRGLMNKIKFPIQVMTLHTAGYYSCIYRSGELWSEQSDSLSLVVTGMYDIPTLSVKPRTELVSGENVTFHCHLETATNTFFLLKDGKSSHPQRRYGENQADFPMGPLTTAHRGTYRCFGSYNDFVWSFPSKPVQLLVIGEYSWDLSPSTTETRLQNAFTFWDHSAQNLFRIGMAILILAATVGLLVEEWLSRKRLRERVIKASSWELRRRFRTRRPFNKSPQMW